MERSEHISPGELVTGLLEGNPEITRRALLGGMYAISALAVAQRLGIETINDRLERVSLSADGCSPHDDIVCHLQAGNVTNVPAAQLAASEPATALPPETTTTLPPTTTTAAPPPPPPSVEAPSELKAAPRREMPYAEFANNAELFLSKVPSLEALHEIFPSTAHFHFIPEQKQHIEYLNQTVQPTPKKYHRFAFNTAYSGAFSASRRALDPKMVLYHWTANHHDDPAHLARAMTSRDSSVQMYVHNDNVAYQLVETLDLVMGHARALNPIAWGIEVYTQAYDKVHPLIFDFTPGTTETAIYAGVNRLRSKALPVNAATFLGHMAADLIFMNPYYDPYTGTFHEVPGYKPPHMHKFDPPQEFMNMVVAKAMALNQQLG